MRASGERPQDATRSTAVPAGRRGMTGAASKACETSARRRAQTGVPAESTLSTRFVRVLVQAMEHAGVPREELLRRAGIEAEELEAAEESMPRSRAYELFELAIDLAGDPALGLHLAEEFTGQAFVPISHLVAHSLTLRQGLESVQHFQRLLGTDPFLELCPQGDRILVRCLCLPGQSQRLRRFSSEMILTSFFRLIRYFNARAQPERVSFEYAAPPYRREYTRVFEHTEHFEEPFTGIVLDRALLDLPSPDKDEGVHDVLRALAEHRATRLARSMPFAMRVREFLVQQPVPRRIGMADVARALGLSARSLRRRLEAEGKSYGEVENDARAMTAKQLLRDGQRTIQETAFEMGFSDTTAFHRAFKRWTGMTPTVYRDAP
jgi:AraC-like DNA-binding protein